MFVGALPVKHIEISVHVGNQVTDSLLMFVSLLHVNTMITGTKLVLLKCFTFIFTFNHLAYALIQSDLQMRTTEAIKPKICKCC